MLRGQKHGAIALAIREAVEANRDITMAELVDHLRKNKIRFGSLNSVRVAMVKHQKKLNSAALRKHRGDVLDKVAEKLAESPRPGAPYAACLSVPPAGLALKVLGDDGRVMGTFEITKDGFLFVGANKQKKDNRPLKWKAAQALFGRELLSALAD